MVFEYQSTDENCCTRTKNYYMSILKGERGVSGERGAAGPQGPKGIQGKSGEVGVSYIRWGKKTCPNTGATLVYEGIKTNLFIFCHRRLFKL